MTCIINCFFCADVDIHSMIDHVNANILQISKSSEYAVSQIIRENVKYVLCALVECTNKFQIFKKLKDQNLHSIAFRNVGSKIVRVFSAAGAESVEIVSPVPKKRTGCKMDVGEDGDEVGVLVAECIGDEYKLLCLPKARNNIPNQSKSRVDEWVATTSENSEYKDEIPSSEKNIPKLKKLKVSKKVTKTSVSKSVTVAENTLAEIDETDVKMSYITFELKHAIILEDNEMKYVMADNCLNFTEHSEVENDIMIMEPPSSIAGIQTITHLIEESIEIPDFEIILDIQSKADIVYEEGANNTVEIEEDPQLEQDLTIITEDDLELETILTPIYSLELTDIILVQAKDIIYENTDNLSQQINEVPEMPKILLESPYILVTERDIEILLEHAVENSAEILREIMFENVKEGIEDASSNSVAQQSMEILISESDEIVTEYDSNALTEVVNEIIAESDFEILTPSVVEFYVEQCSETIIEACFDEIIPTNFESASESLSDESDLNNFEANYNTLKVQGPQSSDKCNPPSVDSVAEQSLEMLDKQDAKSLKTFHSFSQIQLGNISEAEADFANEKGKCEHDNAFLKLSHVNDQSKICSEPNALQLKTPLVSEVSACKALKESIRNELDESQGNESNTASSQCSENSAVIPSDTGVEHSSSNVNTPNPNKEEYGRILENINSNLKNILECDQFSGNQYFLTLVKDILKVLGNSADVQEVVEKLTEMNLQLFTTKIDNLDILLGKDVSPLNSESNIIDIINNNIKRYCSDPLFSRNETAQRKVRTVVDIIGEASSAEDIIDRLHLEGLQYFAEVSDNNRPKSSAAQYVRKEDKSIVGQILRQVTSPVPPEGDAIVVKKAENKTSRSNELNQESIPGKSCVSNNLGEGPRIDRNKESRKVKKFSRGTDGIHSSKVSTEETSEHHDKNATEEGKYGVSQIALEKDNSIHRDISSNPSIYSSNLEINEKRLQLQRSFTQVIRDADHRKSIKRRKRSTISDSNSIVSKILMEKQTVMVNHDPENQMSHSQAKTTMILKNSKSTEDKTQCVFPIPTIIPEPNPAVDCIMKNSKEEGRIRTESVNSENMPDLCPIEDEYDTAEEDALPETCVQIPETTEGSELSSSKDDKHFFLTSFDEDSNFDPSESRDSPSFLTPNLTDDQPADLSLLTGLETKLLSAFDNLLKDASMDPSLIIKKEDFIKSTVAEVLEFNNKWIEQTENINDCSVISVVDKCCDSDHEDDVYDVFDMSMKRLEFIEKHFKGISNEPTEQLLAIVHDKPLKSNAAGSFENNTAARKVEEIKSILSSASAPEEILSQISKVLEKQ